MSRESKIDFNYYDVYEDGRIWSKHRNRWLDGTINEDGYLRVGLKCKDGSFSSFLLHRVIYFYFKGDIPEDMRANHIDENKLNCSVDNINLLSHQDNCNWGTRNERISKHHTGRKIGSPSEETRKKLSQGQKNRFAREGEIEKYYKPIWQYEDGVLVGIYKSVKEASEKTGYNQSCISSASRGCLNRQGNHKLGKYMFYNAENKLSN